MRSLTLSAAMTAALCAAVLSCANRGRSAPPCHADALRTWWLLRAAATDSSVVLSGAIDLTGPTPWTHLTEARQEGAREQLEFRVDSLRVTNDSLSFAFAPLTVSVIGRCATEDSLVVRFSALQAPGTPNAVGTGVMVRR